MSILSSDDSFNVNMNMDDNATISSNTMTQACKETVSPEPEFVKENYPLSVSDKPMETKVMQIFDPSVWTGSWS